jgi:hypothetical protein
MNARQRRQLGAALLRLALLAAFALGSAAPPTALAQSPKGTLHIGILVGGSQGTRGHLEQALLQGLRDQGYVEGSNLVLERRYANGHNEQTPGGNSRATWPK